MALMGTISRETGINGSPWVREYRSGQVIRFLLPIYLSSHFLVSRSYAHKYTNEFSFFFFFFRPTIFVKLRKGNQPKVCTPLVATNEPQQTLSWFPCCFQFYNICCWPIISRCWEHLFLSNGLKIVKIKRGSQKVYWKLRGVQHFA